VIFDYIAVQNFNPAAADKFMDELLERMEAFARQPLMGELREDLGPDVRMFAFRKNYIVLYHPLDDGIDVLRVFHAARDYPRLFHGGP
jgi:plasmid stabilization system protein ParE